MVNLGLNPNDIYIREEVTDSGTTYYAGYSY